MVGLCMCTFAFLTKPGNDYIKVIDTAEILIASLSCEGNKQGKPFLLLLNLLLSRLQQHTAHAVY